MTNKEHSRSTVGFLSPISRTPGLALTNEFVGALSGYFSIKMFALVAMKRYVGSP